MKYLLDTNVLSELQKSRCNPKVKSFSDSIPYEDTFISAVTIGELSYGIEKHTSSKKKHDLSIWLNSKMVERFGGRIIPLDADVMTEWGKTRAKSKRTMPIIDSLIASTAVTHHMILVTRNVKDFEDVEGIMLLNPWD